MNTTGMSQLPAAAKIFVALMVFADLAVLAYGLVHLQPAAPLRLAIWLAAAVAASRLKIKLPGINGNMSVNLPFFLVVVAQLSLPEALLVACFGSLAQSLGRNRAVQIAFNSALLINAVGLAVWIFTAAVQRYFSPPLAILAAAMAYFAANTAPVAVVLWLAERERPGATWVRLADLTLPYYVLSAGVAAIVCCGVKNMEWTLPLVLLGIMYLTYRSYRVYFARSASETKTISDHAS
jgi:hypothetical protein